jgi:DNA processing protein
MRDSANSTGGAAEAAQYPTGELREAWLRLANLQFAARLTSGLLRRFGGDPRALFAAADRELEAAPGIQARHILRIRDESLAPTPRQMEWADAAGLIVVPRSLPEYPLPLAEIPDAPPVIFVRGNWREEQRFAVGMVGSRRATPYGRAIAERLARELCERGLTIVSGGAVGIDTAAHRATVAAGGCTIAVLGCGLDVDYPRENRRLFEQILENGALVTEYPLGAQPEAWRFPQRNRLISGLSMGVVVVEAPQHSGALNTARYTLEHGRTLMSVPGNIDRETSRGTNELLRDGAYPILETQDILAALGIILPSTQTSAQPALPLDDEGEQTGAGEPKPHSAPVPGVTPAQQKLLACLSLMPTHLDSVAQQAGISAAEAGVEITLLELAGLVRRLPGNTYVRCL